MATTCPSCGAEASGRFCSACGASLGGATCPTCEASLTPGARFCHVCGTALGGGRGGRDGRSREVPWLVAGGAVLALVIVLAFTLGRAGARNDAPAGGAFGAAPAPVMRAPDISTMTPRERANRLFDRVMSLAERGESDSVAFFTPMALQAYALLGPPDNDARYDVGMIHAVTGAHAAALAQADSLDAAAPGHLLASVVRHTVAEAQGDSAAVRRAYQRFLEHYEREIAANRPEYEAHRPTLDAFRDEARRAVGQG